MKKGFGLLLAAILIFGGCSTKAEPIVEEPMEMANGQTIQTVVDKIADRIGMDMPADVKDTVLKDLFFISPAYVEDYAGKISMQPTSMNQIVAVKANPEKSKKVLKGLKKRLSDMKMSFSQNHEDENEQILQGQVVEKGNYIFLIILCEDSETIDTQMQEIIKIIEEVF